MGETKRLDTIARPGKPYDADIYDANYFLRGKETGKSLYENYHWIPELTLPMCRAIIDFCGIRQTDTILDFGCARGYVVKALRQLGYEATGIDISKWAIEHCDPAVMEHVSCRALPEAEVDWIIAKDVLEHLDGLTLEKTLIAFGEKARKGVFIVVPLAPGLDLPYVVPEYELDVTHKQRMTLVAWSGWVNAYFGAQWVGRVQSDWSVRAQYRVEGIKDNWSQYPKGNGFILARRKEGQSA